MNFYGQSVTPYQLLSGEIPPPEAASCLYQSLNNAIAASDRFRGISSSERQHQDMLRMLDPHNSSRSFQPQANPATSSACETDQRQSRGIGDQYY
jgi:hypothetical protein